MTLLLLMMTITFLVAAIIFTIRAVRFYQDGEKVWRLAAGGAASSLVGVLVTTARSWTWLLLTIPLFMFCSYMLKSFHPRQPRDRP